MFFIPFVWARCAVFYFSISQVRKKGYIKFAFIYVLFARMLQFYCSGWTARKQLFFLYGGRKSIAKIAVLREREVLDKFSIAHF